jgi:ribosomal protein S27E
MVAFLLPAAAVVPVVREAPAVYHPRRPERTAFYRTLEEHFEEFALVHEDRFERKDGPLRPVVRKAVDAFLACGRPENGFARVRCPDCRAEYLVPFSCQTRNFCPSCQQKRALLLAEKLREEILAPVPHLHLIFTIPIALRRLFLRERRLLGLLTRCAFETVTRCFRAVLDCRSLRRPPRLRRGRSAGVPGMVAAIQCFGSQAQWNPHVHSLASAGLLLRGGEFVPLPPMDAKLESLLTETYRRLVLDALVEEDRLTEGFRDELLRWGHGGGFSVYGRHLILNEEPSRLAHMARYAVRAPADRRLPRSLLPRQAAEAGEASPWTASAPPTTATSSSRSPPTRRPGRRCWPSTPSSG